MPNAKVEQETLLPMFRVPLNDWSLPYHVVAAGVVTAPLAEEYHFLLFLPYVATVCISVWRGYSDARALGAVHWVCLLAIAVMAAPLRYKALEFASFPLILLAYPKLYAGVVLLLLRARVTARTLSPSGTQGSTAIRTKII